MWPFGHRKTVAEQRQKANKQMKGIEDKLSKLHQKIINLEKKEPYEKNDLKRKRMALQKLSLEKQVQQIEKKKAAIEGAVSG